MRSLSSRTQLDTSTPEVLKRDLGRLVESIDEMFGSLGSFFRERLYRDRIISVGDTRPGLKFGALSLVDTGGGNVTLYLPKALKSDAGRVLGFVKRYANNHVNLQTTDGSLINGFYDRIEGMPQLGVHELLWDGSGWWIREPAARIRSHDLRHEPVGLWGFGAGSLVDSTANGFDLTVETGTERYAYISPTLLGFQFDGSTSLWYDVSEATLRLLGDMTFECLWMQDDAVNSGGFISHEAAGETEATNCLYLLQTGGTYPSLAWFSESGLGVNASYTSTYGHPTRGALCHLAVTRTSNVIQFYVNGRPYGNASTALVTPTGGADSRLRLGSTLAVRSKGIMASAKLIASALTAAQIRAEYQLCMGWSFGYLNEF
jgi:hypothetical protein